MNSIFLAIFSTVFFRGDTLIYLQNENLLIIKGNGYVLNGETEIYSDSIVFNTQTERFKAFKGFTLILSKVDSIYGDSLFYNNITKRGLAHNARTKAEKGFLTGKTIYRWNEIEYFIEKSTFTTCDRDPPHYCFYSKEVKLIREDMAISRPVIFKLFNIPLIYLPYWYFPIAERRKSGFLTPRFGRHSLDGLFLRNLSYYWVINNFTDITISLDLLQLRGVRGGVYIPIFYYPNLKGELNLSTAYEFNPRRYRYSASGGLFYDSPRRLKIQAKIDYSSDLTYIFDYSAEKEEWLKTELLSYLSFSYPFRGGMFNVIMDDRRDLARNILRTTIPKVTYTLFNRKLGPINFSSNFALERGEDKVVSYRKNSVFENSTNLGTQIRVLKYFTLIPSVGNVVRIYEKGIVPDYKYLPYFHQNYSVTLGTTLYGRSLFGLLYFKRFDQIIKPSLSYSLTKPYGEFSKLEPFRSYVVAKKSQSLRLSLSTDFQGFWVRDTIRRKIDLARLTGSLDYVELQGFWDYRLGPFLIELFPGSSLSGRSNVFYDLKERRLRNYNILVDWSFKINVPRVLPIGGGGRFSYIYEMIPERYFLSLEINGALKKVWSFSMKTSFDLEKKDIVEQSFLLTRSLHCFKSQFRFVKFGKTWLYDFKIWIDALPEIRVEKSFFEAILP